jgi:nucleoside-diphosphate-sugar epimerase
MPNAQRTVLVTGGAGYIGSHVVRQLLERGDRVRVLDLLLYGNAGLKALANHPRLSVVVGDVRDPAAMREAAADGVDTVIALAALVGDAACELDRGATVAINHDATELLVETCLDVGVRRLVFASSCNVYGTGADQILMESSTLNPVSLYARTQAAAERIIDAHAGRLSAVTLRLATVFGVSPRMRLDLLVNTLTVHAYFRRRLRVSGRAQPRPHVHVRDAATALLLAADARDTLVRGQRFNVGDDRSSHSVREIAAIVGAAVPGTEVLVEPHLCDVRTYRVSFSKIRKTLGFSRQLGVEDGVAEVVAACRRGAIAGLDDPRHSNFESLKRFGVPEILSPAA